MYEDISYEDILERMLERVPDSIDKREGSVIYDALAPAAMELKLAYDEMDLVYNETFADTATRHYLVKRTAERGITPYPATYALLEGTFTPMDLTIPVGTRFSGGGLTYAIQAKVTDGVYQVRCEVLGTEGNKYFGSLIPIDYVDGLETAALTRLLIPADDEEDTEHLRERYFASMETQAYGGNRADYREKVTALEGVGDVKVYRTPDGPGTVRLVIISSTYEKPTDALIEDVQIRIDPEWNQGDGVGIAPIGHLVSVEGVWERKVNITTSLVLETGWTFADVLPYLRDAVDEYFQELSRGWAKETQLVVRISQMDSRFLLIDPVIDVEDTTLDGLTENLIIEADEIPIRGSVDGQTITGLLSGVS